MPAIMLERYGVSAVELCQMHFCGQDAEYLDRIAQGLHQTGSAIVNIPVDTGNISAKDKQKRFFDLRIIKSWMDIAHYLKSPAVRVNTGYQEGEPDLSITVDSYRQLIDYGRGLGLTIIVENHGGLSNSIDNMVTLFQELDCEDFRSCPDFGEFDTSKRYEDLARIAQYAFLVHVKTYDFNPDGSHSHFDVKKCIHIVESAGFNGYYSVEFEGEGDQYEGVKNTIELVGEALTGER